MSFPVRSWINLLPTAESSLAALALALVVGVSLPGCQSGSRSQAPSGAALADSLAEGYQWLERQYEQTGDPMPPAMRGMRGRMQAMHDRMMEGRGGGMGRMKGMMGERGAEGSARDTTGEPFRMGHGDMSAMHETMARMHGE